MSKKKWLGSSFDDHMDRLAAKNKKFREAYDREINELPMSAQIAIARRKAGLTQTQIAKKLSVSQSAVAQIENRNANPTLKTVEKVARLIGYRLSLIPHAA